jgi:hypothetical protein
MCECAGEHAERARPRERCSVAWYSPGMSRKLLVLFIALAACGGKQKSTTPPPPLPEPKPEAKPAEEAKQEPKEPAKPPIPQGPLELTFPAAKHTVKLVNGGKGKKSALKLTSKAGDKQSVELTMDFSGKQILPPELGGTTESQVAPTIVLLADFETKEVAADGATKFAVTINGVDARDVPGAKTPGADFKNELLSLTGATIQGAVNANGSMSDLTLRVEKPDQNTMGAMNLLKLSLMPMWPVLPTEAIAPGAKWQVATATKVAERLEVTQTTDYQLVSKKGKAWVIKGTTKVSGTEQEIGEGPEKAKFGSIAGSGSHEATINEGTLLPTATQSVTTDFTATAEAQDGSAKKISLQFHLEQGNSVKPSGTAGASGTTPATPATKDTKATPATPATPAPKADAKKTP